MEEKLIFPVGAFEALPQQGIPPSSYVDFLLLLGDLKPAVRLCVTAIKAQYAVRIWCEDNGYALVSNSHGYVCVARTQYGALRLQALDDGHESHEYEFGLLLGYPPCCCRRAAEIGEINLDEWERTMSQDDLIQRTPNCLIDPRGYTEGSSLISHIPCSAQCEASLSIAKAALRLVNNHRGNKHFSRWARWIDLSGAY